MDLVRPYLLRQISLRTAAEGDETIYLAQDRANERVFVLNPENARALRRFLRAALHPSAAARAAARAETDADEARHALAALQVIQNARVTELTHRKPFNPIFAQIPLFDAGLVQPALRGIARFAGGVWVVGLMAVLLVAVALLGIRNDWQILDALGNIFSLEAILTFGLVAPFLKIIHELGHILAATRHGVRVRKAGLYVIGLYPMPYVDCSRADMTATRGQRMAIAGAGVVTDIIVGLIAFILWHLVEGDYLRVLLVNIFFFCTINSLLFNGNPLIRLDGYYVFADALGQRNLATRGNTTLRSLRRWITSFGVQGRRPQGADWWVAAYGLGALAYRINILIIIAAALLPAYLGFGALVTAWGAYVMFLSPMMRTQPAAVRPSAKGDGWRTAGWWLGWGLAATLLLALVRWPVVVVVPVTLDSDGRYQLTASGAGQVVSFFQSGPVPAGTELLRLANPNLESDLADLEMTMVLARQLLEGVSGVNAAQALAAERQLQGLLERAEVLRRQQAALVHQAPEEGVFIPQTGLKLDEWVQPGARLGIWYPRAGEAVFSGPFPENFLIAAAELPEQVVLRMGTARIIELSPTAIELREIMSRDASSGIRNLRVFVTVEGETPADLAGATPHVRLRYASVPLWMHVGYGWSRLTARFYEAQMQDRSRILEN